jgi:hypothetical protein
MIKQKKLIRDRSLVEICGKEFPPMLFALIQVSDHHYQVQSYVKMDALPKTMQEKIRQLLRIESAQNAIIKEMNELKRKRKNKARN